MKLADIHIYTTPTPTPTPTHYVDAPRELFGGRAKAARYASSFVARPANAAVLTNSPNFSSHRSQIGAWREKDQFPFSFRENSQGVRNVDSKIHSNPTASVAKISA
jgi:hypothetical protein